MKTLSYVLGEEKEIEKGETYYFGQIWDGNCDGETLLLDGSICVDEEKALIVKFVVLEKDDDDICRSIIKVVDIY